jgi:hypothetical protein
MLGRIEPYQQLFKGAPWRFIGMGHRQQAYSVIELTVFSEKMFTNSRITEWRRD